MGAWSKRPSANKFIFSGKNMEVQGDSLIKAPPLPAFSANLLEDLSVPVWDADQLRLAVAAAGVALWSWNVDTN